MSLMAFPSDPPLRFVSFGPVGFVQKAGPGEHLLKHMEVKGEQARALGATFRAIARECESALPLSLRVLSRISGERLSITDLPIGKQDEKLARMLHGGVIMASADAARAADEIVDPNLYELTDQHVADVLVGLSSEARIIRQAMSRRDTRATDAMPSVPDLRVVLTAQCPINCPYCPVGNEGFRDAEEVPEARAIEAVSIFAAAAQRCGMRAVALTGGEPTAVAGWVDAVTHAVQSSRRVVVQLQTAGYGLVEDGAVSRLAALGSRLRIKLSHDPGHAQAGTVAKEAISRLLEGGVLSNAIEVNYVADAKGLKAFDDFLTPLREKRISLKILDLLWYSDLGSRAGQISAERFFRDNYVDMESIRNRLIDIGYMFVGYLDKHFGVMEEVYEDCSGHRVRVRDTARGTTYSNRCTTCNYYTEGLCQEGVYQVEVTSDWRLRLCRHRRDLSRPVADEIGADLAGGTTHHIERALMEYVSENYTGLQREARFAPPDGR